MRSCRVRVDTKPKGHFFVRRERHTKRRHTEKKPRDYAAGDCSDAATSQDTKHCQDPPEAWKRQAKSLQRGMTRLIL